MGGVHPSTTEEALVAEMMPGLNQRVEFIIGPYWKRMETCDSCKRPVEVHTGLPPSMKPFFQYTCIPCNTAQEAIRRKQQMED